MKLAEKSDQDNKQIDVYKNGKKPDLIESDFIKSLKKIDRAIKEKDISDAFTQGINAEIIIKTKAKRAQKVPDHKERRAYLKLYMEFKKELNQATEKAILDQEQTFIDREDIDQAWHWDENDELDPAADNE